MPPLRLLPLLLLTAAPPGFAENLVTNGDFTAGAAPWSLRLAPGCEASLVINEGEASVLVVAGTSSRWTVNLEQPLSAPLRRGVTYLVSFEVRSDTPRPIDAVLRLPGGNILGSAYSIPVTTERRRESFSYAHAGEDSPCRIAFRLGGEPGAISIDNVVVEPAPAP